MNFSDNLLGIFSETVNQNFPEKERRKKNKRQERRNFVTRMRQEGHTRRKSVPTFFVDFGVNFQMALVSFESVQPLMRYSVSKLTILAVVS